MNRCHLKYCKRLAVIAMAAAIVMVPATGCIHQSGPEMEPATDLTSVEVRVVCDRQWNCADTFLTAKTEERLPLRYTIALYRRGARVPLQSQVTVEPSGGNATFRFEGVEQGEYDIRGWCEHCSSTGGVPLYYNSSDLSEIALLAADYGLNDPQKEAFGGSMEWQADHAAGQHRLELVVGRVHGAYCLVAENSGAEIEAAARGGQLTATLSYSGFVPVVFDLVRDVPVDAATFAPLSCRVSSGPDGDIILASDQLFTPPAGSTHVSLNVDIFNMSGQRIASTGYIDVDVSRATVSVLRVPLASGESSGGLIVDPGFSGDFNIFIP